MDNFLGHLVENKAINIQHDDYFWADYYEYLEDERVKNIQEKFRVPNFTVGETSVAYRVINHWEAKGLLPERQKGSKWHRFNLIELVWIQTIIRLRKIGFSIDSIIKTKKAVMEWSDEFQTYPMLEYFMFLSVTTALDAYFYILPDGKAAIASSQEIEGSKSIFGSKDVTLISLKSILRDIGLKPKKPEQLFSLNKKEIDLLYEMRNEKEKEIRLKIAPDKHHKFEELKTIKSYPKSPSYNDILKELKDFEKNFFGELTFKFENGKRQSAAVKKISRSLNN